ncbi:unnamed protein product [Soboliphyme baturini]|uniref:GNAT family N-acetyltransferase n=1 Tax=Soboliphyme baturini TaxID=241478 RepID=A0A183IQG0_9BILA|nr:unnamed protein product [Soboliphyme baturini]
MSHENLRGFTYSYASDPSLDQWMRSQPLSILKLDPADRIVLKIAGMVFPLQENQKIAGLIFCSHNMIIISSRTSIFRKFAQHTYFMYYVLTIS